MNPCMKVQEAKGTTGKRSGCNLQLTLKNPAQKEVGTLSAVEVQSILARAPRMQCNAQGVEVHSACSPGIIFPPAVFLISRNDK